MRPIVIALGVIALVASLWLYQMGRAHDLALKVEAAEQQLASRQTALDSEVQTRQAVEKRTEELQHEVVRLEAELQKARTRIAPAEAPGSSTPAAARNTVTQALPAQTNPGALPAAAGEVLLTSPEGQAVVRNQLAAYRISPDGAIESPPVEGTRPNFLTLHGTQNRSFELRGEVKLGSQNNRLAFPQDLPDGIMLVFREADPTQRYEINTRRARVKRRLYQGKVATGITVTENFEAPEQGVWIPFGARVTPAEIAYQFGSHSGVLQGPLATDGDSSISLVPGTLIRNVGIRFLGD